MESNKYIPLEGDSSTFFERVSEYVKMFDSDWENAIKGASREKIDKYIEVATKNNKQIVIPEEYIIYLEKMGEDDGGLLENFICGSTNIDLLIGCYESVNPYADEMPEGYDEILECCDENTIGYLRIGFNTEVETEIFLKYNNHFDYEINRTASINPKFQEDNWFSSTFEKLLFQSIVFRYIYTTKKYGKECVVPTCFIKENNVIDAKKVMNQIDKVCQKQWMTKAWISDQYNYIAYNDTAIVYMKLDFNLYGDVWSDDEQFAIELSDSIKHIWGYTD